MEGADLFAGLSTGGLLKPEMVKSMADRPIIFAMANPDPEIGYNEAKSNRDDLIMATGRSDYPNQVNNVLGFPFIFRGSRCAGIDNKRRDENCATHALASLAKQGNIPDSSGCLRAGVTLLRA